MTTDPDQLEAQNALLLASLATEAGVTLPPPHRLRQLLADGLERSYQAVVAARGPAWMPEDTYDTQRRLALAREIFTAYGSAFTYAAKLIGGYQETELIAAVGEQDGQPNQGITVPDRAGDIRLTVEFDRAQEFDTDQLISAAALSAGETQDDSPEYGERAIRTFLELGKFEPQVTKVKAYAADLARNGHDQAASVVGGAIRPVRKTYKGVKTERKAAK